MVDIYIFRQDNNGIILWTHDSKKNTITEKNFDILARDISPSFTLPRDLLEPLLEAILKRWIKPAEQSFIQGELQATKGHLSDMRKLLKIK